MESLIHMQDHPDLEVCPDFLKDCDLSNRENIRRPDCPKYNVEFDNVEFMQIDTDYYTAVAPAYIKNNDGKETSIIRMFGIT